MKALRLHAKGELKLDEVDMPSLRDGEVLVKVGACGVCGSDIGRILYKESKVPLLVPGHEFAGTVAAVGKNCSPDWVGKRVCVFPLIPCQKCDMCRAGQFAQCGNYQYLGSRNNGGFAQYVAVPEWNLVPLPSSLPLETAALTEPVAVSLHALRIGQVSVGDSVAVLGAGFIGLVIALLAKSAGASQVILVDINGERLAFAKKLGFDLLINSKEENAVEAIGALTNGKGVSVSFEGTGSGAALETCVLGTRPQGKIVLVGNPGGGVALPLDAYSQILRRQLTLCGSWNSSFADTPKNDWVSVVDLLASGKIDALPLVTHTLPLHEVDRALSLLRGTGGFYLKIIFIPEA